MEFSAWDTYPTEEDPERKFQFSRVMFSRSMDLITHSRQTYGLLEWIGDVGGLLDGLYIAGSFLVSPFAAIALNQKLNKKLIWWFKKPNLDESLEMLS